MSATFGAPDPRDLPPSLSQRDLSRRWRLSVRTLERWRAAGSGPPWLMIGASIRYLREDVLAWEQAHRQGD